MGDWDGKTMASIIRDSVSSSSAPFSKSREIGAGKLLIDQSQLYAFGYKVSVQPYPIVRRFAPDGSQIWQKAWPDLVDDMPYGSLKVGNDVVMLSGSTYSSKDERIARFVRFDRDGNEVARKEVKVGMSEFIIGQWALLSRLGPDLALIVNSRQFGNFGSSEALFGLPTLCPGPLEATVYLLDATTFEVRKTLKISDLQVIAADGGDQELKIGGQTRGSCEDSGKGILLRVTPGLRSSTVWKDDDAFPSNIQAVATSTDEILFAVKRQRPIGVRRLGAAAPEVATKRWGDGGDELLEFSILKLGVDGRAISIYDSAFGLSSFAQGLVLHRGSRSSMAALAVARRFRPNSEAIEAIMLAVCDALLE
ncbi:hypothetical protein XH87_08980 [Bradyrhizobium sp. CCBAU 53415]|nr:hypothetical protein [Bradyrhizobium sp. CCBAU 53415]